MKSKLLFCFYLCFFISASQAQPMSKDKQSLLRIVESHDANLIKLSDQIWAFAETALAETKSAKVLADYAEQQGFTIERGVPGMPTAFIASYGSGQPIIGVLGEFDALPGLSQKAQASKEALKKRSRDMVVVIIYLEPVAWVLPLP